MASIQNEHDYFCKDGLLGTALAFDLHSIHDLRNCQVGMFVLHCPILNEIIRIVASFQAILAHMRVECKCHGVSGSCEVKTCWKAMPPFRKVGNVIKEKFDGATEVEQRKTGSAKVLVPRNSQFKPHTDEDLVYLEPSPDFCDHDPRTPGMLGTVGRQCNRTSKAIDGCELMCCGRGFQTQQVEVVDRCSCKFHWCCYVKCKQCRKMEEMHTCR